MLIRCWGARGSIPVTGTDFQKYGGDTTCIEVRTKTNDLIILDAGSGLRQLGNNLKNSEHREIHLLLTHLHMDHLMGFYFFKPFFNPDTHVHIYGRSGAGQSLRKNLEQFFSPPYAPISMHEVHAQLSFHPLDNQPCQIGSVTIHTIPLNHPGSAIGYKFEENSISFVFMTDNELGGLSGDSYDDFVAFAKDADLLIHDAEYLEEEYRTQKGWGHSFYLDALNLAIKSNAKQFGLFHHNQNRTDSQIDQMVQLCRQQLINQKSEINCFALKSNMKITL